MDTIWHDVRYALRTLAKQGGFTAVTVSTLALAIGATTVIFALVDAILLKPLPYEDPARLVMVRDVQPSLDDAPASYPEYLDWQENAAVFSAAGAYFTSRVSLTGEGEPERLEAARVSAGLLSMLGIHPLLGREITKDDEPPGAERVVWIGYGFWQRRLGGEPNPIGRVLRLDGDDYSIAGVLPPGVANRLPEDLTFGKRRELWLPLRLDAERSPRGFHFLRVLGRLRPGVTWDQAGSEIEALSAHLQEDGRTRHGIRLAALAERVVGDARPRLLMLLGAVGLVLLIACVNVANLLLARASVRRKEIAVRMAVGASRGRVVAQLAAESLILAVTGGLLGVLVAVGSLRWFAAARIGDLPRAAEIGIDATVLGFAAAVTLLTAAAFGLAPAIRSAATGLTEAFRDAGRQGGSGRRPLRIRSLLVVVEVALSMVLLVGAGLLLRSFAGLTHVDLGFETENVAAAALLLPEARYPDDEARVRFFDQALESVKALPGIEGAALVNSLPLDGGPNGSFQIDGITWPEGESPLVEKRRTSPDYFRVMGIPLVRGRFFNDQDTAGSRPVALVNQELVRRFLPPGEDPIGRRIDFQWNNEGMQEIVGVVGDVKHRDLDLANEPAIYVPYRQNAQSSMMVVFRSSLEPRALGGVVRREIQAIDPELPVSDILTMDDVMASTLTQRRLATALLSGFAAAALLLAVLGIYGVISYSATRRTQEMGIRMALGAGRWRILTLVVGQGLRLAVLGAGIGVVGALVLTRSLASLLFGVTATDPLTFALVLPILLLVAVAACYLPARRASRVDPVVALHYE